MGGSWALYKKVQDLFGQTQGGYSFNGTYTGIGYADMLLGLGNYQELAVQDHGLWNNVSWAAYVQDNWRVNRRLTLNLGVRWDGVHTYEANNRQWPTSIPVTLQARRRGRDRFRRQYRQRGRCPLHRRKPRASAASPNSAAQLGIPLYLNGIGIPGQNGVPKGLVNNHWAAFGPRLGFAYDLTGNAKTVVRGGFGIMYERIQGNDVYNAGPNLPFSLRLSTSERRFDLSNPSLGLHLAS